MEAYQVYHDAGVERVVAAMRDKGGKYQLYNGEHRFWPQWPGACHQSSGDNAAPLVVYEGSGGVTGLVVAYCHSCSVSTMGSVHALLGWRTGQRKRQDLPYGTSRPNGTPRCVGCGKAAAPGGAKCVMCELGWTRPARSERDEVVASLPACGEHAFACALAHGEAGAVRDVALACGERVCAACG